MHGCWSSAPTLWLKNNNVRSISGPDQLIVKAGEGQILAYCQIEIGGIVKGQVVLLGQSKNTVIGQRINQTDAQVHDDSRKSIASHRVMRLRRNPISTLLRIS